MKKKKIITLVVVLAVAAVLAGGFFAWRGTVRATVQGPQLEELEALLKERSGCVTDLQVTVARPTANFDIYVEDAGEEELLYLLKTVADYINEEELYETVLMPAFRLPHIWAEGVRVTFRQGWGPFARTLQEYDCLHDATSQTYEEIAALGFRQWQLRADSFQPERQLPELVYEVGAGQA